MDRTSPRVAVLGAGAVGCYFGGMLARSGVPVTFIGRQQHVEAIRERGLGFESAHFTGQIPAAASTEVEDIRDAQIILFCVKTLDTEEAAKAMQPHLGPDTLIVSMQNGVDNTARMHEATGIDAVSSVVYVACEMVGPGKLKHNGRGDLILGNRGQKSEELARLFERAGVPCPVSGHIEADLWAKMIMNCVFNPMSALGRAKYARLMGNPLTADVMRLVVDEAVAVAGKTGVSLDGAALREAALQLGVSMAGATSSMAQDLARGRTTEIDSLNGYVVRRGRELGVPTPVNQVLHALVKTLEEGLPAG